VTAEEHQLIQDELQAHLTGNRTESAALLAWFMHTVWRVEPEDIETAICDGKGDKGIDGLLVNDDLGEITIFQSKHHVNADGGQGDVALKNLVGSAVYFASPEAVDGLVASKPNPDLTRLLKRLRIRDKVAEGAHVTRLAFVTDGTLDPAGKSYVTAQAGQAPLLEVWDLGKIAAVAERTRSPELLPDKVILESAADAISVDLNGEVRLAVGVVPAAQLVGLPGIEDLSLFDRNVRLSEGRTRINRELGETLAKKDEHPLFPAYHNGLTLLTHGLEVKGPRISLDGIAVVNGCQSLLTLHDHRGDITDDLRMLVKVVKVDKHTDLADKITYRSNNQNPVDIRDQRSTDAIQRDLQKQVADLYSEELAYAIRQGETFKDGITVLDNQTAAQFITAVYLGEPWNSVRKVRLFDDDYRRIFNRTVDGHRLYLIELIVEAVFAAKDRLRPEIASSFASVRLTVAHLLSQVLRMSEAGTELMEHPDRWLPELREAVLEKLAGLVDEVVDSVNAHIQEEEADQGEAFDPKLVFKSQMLVGRLEHYVLQFAGRLAKRDDEYLFQIDTLR
jgi:hypothetical protein